MYYFNALLDIHDDGITLNFSKNLEANTLEEATQIGIMMRALGIKIEKRVFIFGNFIPKETLEKIISTENFSEFLGWKDTSLLKPRIIALLQIIKEANLPGIFNTPGRLIPSFPGFKGTKKELFISNH